MYKRTCTNTVITGILVVFYFGILVENIRAEKGILASDLITRFGPGVKSASLGGAFTGLANDPTAVYWNPAGLPQVKKHFLYFTYSSLFGLANYEFISLLVPLPNKAAFAISWTRHGTANIPIYADLRGTSKAERKQDALLGVKQGTFNNDEQLIQFTFAKTFITSYLTDQVELLPEPIKIYLGMSMKGYRQVLFDATGIFSSLDFGALAQIKLDFSLFGENSHRDLFLGLAVQNAIKSDKQWNYGSEPRDEVPTIQRFGIALQENVARFLSVITITYERDYEIDKTDHYGVEYAFNKMAFLRIGLNNDTITSGVELKIKNYWAGYAFQDHALDPVHVISLAYEF